MSSKIRIIGGKHKGRKLSVLEQKDLRPTTDRVRENVFNWLQFEVREKRCLDLFAGTGALGFEALSRGAKHVTFIEKQTKAAEQIRQNIELLNESSYAEIFCLDALKYIARFSGEPYDIIFLDPPFKGELLLQTCSLLNQGSGLIHEQTLIYVEQAKATKITFPENWNVFKYGEVGQVSYGLYEQAGATC